MRIGRGVGKADLSVGRSRRRLVETQAVLGMERRLTGRSSEGQRCRRRTSSSRRSSSQANTSRTAIAASDGEERTARAFICTPNLRQPSRHRRERQHFDLVDVVPGSRRSFATYSRHCDRGRLCVTQHLNSEPTVMLTHLLSHPPTTLRKAIEILLCSSGSSSALFLCPRSSSSCCALYPFLAHLRLAPRHRSSSATTMASSKTVYLGRLRRRRVQGSFGSDPLFISQSPAPLAESALASFPRSSSVPMPSSSQEFATSARPKL